MLIQVDNHTFNLYVPTKNIANVRVTTSYSGPQGRTETELYFDTALVTETEEVQPIEEEE